MLITDRLALRRFTADDVDLLVELDSDPEVMRYLTGGVPTSREEVERALLTRVLPSYERPPGSRWAAVEVATGDFIGWFALTPKEGGLELGYRLRRSAWGQGYATEGSLALIAWAFTELNADRVYAETMFVNIKSRRVLEKAGLRHVRTFHRIWDNPIDGTEHGEVEYELLRPDWTARLR